jgi:predicted RNase H-like HicB family nuclease
MRYAVVIEKAENNHSAYVPDPPGCIATGATVEEAEQMIRAAIELHLTGLREDGLPVPQPSSQVAALELGIASQVEPVPSNSGTRVWVKSSTAATSLSWSASPRASDSANIPRLANQIPRATRSK